ncbi:MAG TPA: purine-nucleoside phosphorylase [Candidatus Nitrosocosmicus sp.]|nr:purine-nucleoside phosphorylase [Candidatus Nitrosocosmicus sp.]
MFSITQIQSNISKLTNTFPVRVVILGSGWNKILETLTVEAEISYSDLFDVTASVPGHEGRLVIAQVNGKRVAFMSGRFHLYEGYSAYEATLPIRIFAQLGMKELVLTSASGAINEKYKVGDFMVLSDIITLFLKDNPLKGPEFIDMSEVFDQTLREKAMKTCIENAIPFHEGIYCFTHGPHFETPADKMTLKIIGSDVVGMSTVPETIMARALGVKVLGLSFITNLAFVKHEHKDVLAEANKASSQMTTLLEGILK